MEDTDDFKWAAKVVIRRQLRDLLQQLQEYGDDVAVMLANTSENTYTHFGSSAGEWFISEQRNLLSNFLDFCKTHQQRKKKITGAAGKQLIQIASGETKSVRQIKKESNVDLLNIYIPNIAREGISDIALESLAGRLVALVMTGSQQNGCNPMEDQNEEPALPSPTVSRSGRKIRAKVLDNFVSLPKVSRSRNFSQEGRKLLDSLGSLESTILQKVQVKVGNGKFVNVASTSLPTSEEMRILALSVLNELDSLNKSYQLSTNKHVQVVVIYDDVKEETVKATLVKANQDIENEKPQTATCPVETGNVDNVAELNGLETVDEDSIEHEVPEEYMTENQSKSDPDYKPLKTTQDLPLGRKRVHTTIQDRVEARRRAKARTNSRKRSLTETVRVPCDHCGQMLSGLGNLKAHIQCVHMNIRKAACNVCGKAFFNHGKLNVHIVDVHTRQCPSCKEYVTESEPWKEGVTNRMVREVLCKCGEQVPVVTMVGRRIPFKDDDEEGMEKKKRDPPGTRYSCGVCGKIFLRKRSCVVHAKGHKEMKDHMCDLCGMSFTYAGSLKKHLGKEHGQNQHFCEICGGVYSSEMTLKIHMSKVHHRVDLGENYNVDNEMAKKMEIVEEALTEGSNGGLTFIDSLSEAVVTIQ